MIKKVITAAVVLSVAAFGLAKITQAEESNEYQKYEVIVPIETKCYPTEVVQKLLHPAEIVMVSQDVTREDQLLIDYLVYSPKKNGIFMIRENMMLQYTCVISYFNKTENKKE